MNVIKFLVLAIAGIFAYNYFYEDLLGVKAIQGEWVMDRNKTLREYRRAGLPEPVYQEIRKVVKTGAKSTIDGKRGVMESGEMTIEYTYEVVSSDGNCYTLRYEPAPIPGLDTSKVCVEGNKLIVHTPFNGAKEHYTRAGYE